MHEKMSGSSVLLSAESLPVNNENVPKLQCGEAVSTDSVCEGEDISLDDLEPWEMIEHVKNENIQDCLQRRRRRRKRFDRQRPSTNGVISYTGNDVSNPSCFSDNGPSCQLVEEGSHQAGRNVTEFPRKKFLLRVCSRV
jgi:hypothetical protein